MGPLIRLSKLSSVISKESRCDDKSCSSFSKDLLASRLNFDLLLQYIEKQRQVNKSISKLLDENNKAIKEQGEILNTIKDYYEKLYTIRKNNFYFPPKCSVKFYG
jgi:hypothetical protein